MCCSIPTESICLYLRFYRSMEDRHTGIYGAELYEHISMEEIANYTGRSLSTFKRDFKKCSALSPREWLIRRRLEAAHGLIRKGGRKVSEICFEVGFKNLSHFSKIYKIAYGVPPTEDI